MGEQRRPLVLVAAGGLAREVLAVVRGAAAHEVIGVVDDDTELHGRDVDGVPVLGGLEVAAIHPTAELVICAGKGSARARIARRLARLGVPHERYGNVVHPSVDLPSGFALDRGTILLAHVAVTADVRVGRHVVVMPNATITHDDVLEDFATICAGVSLGGWVVVGEQAYLGMNSSVRERVRIGRGATLGMAAALLTDVPDGETWAGVPARRLAATVPGHPSRVGVAS
ncbi:NeuD/PglB/VioB family sugar acetyltransferase [Georgenia yuyongxinii]